MIGVAPDTDEMLDTGPPRANGGNMDNPHLVVGTTVYFPVFVPGALYATTGFATTLDEAAKNATRYMVDYLADVRGLPREDAFLLCSLAGDLQIAEAVDTPNMLVAMHMPKDIFAGPR